MLIIGLTGSIGMGKSTAADRFRAHGIAVIDADAEVHALYAGAAVAPIEAAFPGATRDGAVDRAALSVALMKDPTGFKRLEAIVHPLVLQVEREKLAAEFRRGASCVVLEVPLLFETGGDARVDVLHLARDIARPQLQLFDLAELLEAIEGCREPVGGNPQHELGASGVTALGGKLLAGIDPAAGGLGDRDCFAH